jgi:hypothetical protein
MADITSVDLARRVGENLEQASPDLLRAMVQTFAGADGRRDGRALRGAVWAGKRGPGELPQRVPPAYPLRGASTTSLVRVNRLRCEGPVSQPIAPFGSHPGESAGKRDG